MKKLLLTGLEPFNDYSYNVSSKVVEKLSLEKFFIEGESIEVSKIILPMAFDEFRDVLRKKIKEVSPNFVISFGMDFKDSEKFSFEILARKVPQYGEFLDANGQKGVNEKLDDCANVLHHPHKNLLNEFFKKNNDYIVMSNDAGSHVCETVFRDIIRISNNGKNFLPAFIHVPHTPDLTGNPKHKHVIDVNTQVMRLQEMIQSLCNLV